MKLTCTRILEPWTRIESGAKFDIQTDAVDQVPTIFITEPFFCSCLHYIYSTYSSYKYICAKQRIATVSEMFWNWNTCTNIFTYQSNLCCGRLLEPRALAFNVEALTLSHERLIGSYRAWYFFPSCIDNVSPDVRHFSCSKQSINIIGQNWATFSAWHQIVIALARRPRCCWIYKGWLNT